jgi:hypothetical protein
MPYLFIRALADIRVFNRFRRFFKQQSDLSKDFFVTLTIDITIKKYK